MSRLASSGSSEGHCRALDRPLPPDADLVITSGDIPRGLCLPPLHPDNAADKNGGGGSGNINEENSQCDGNEYSEISRAITMEDLGLETDQGVVGSSSKRFHPHSVYDVLPLLIS